MTREMAIKELDEEVYLLEAKMDAHNIMICKLEQEYQEFDNNIKFLKAKRKDLVKVRN